MRKGGGGGRERVRKGVKKWMGLEQKARNERLKCLEK